MPSACVVLHHIGSQFKYIVGISIKQSKDRLNLILEQYVMLAHDFKWWVAAAGWMGGRGWVGLHVRVSVGVRGACTPSSNLQCNV